MVVETLLVTGVCLTGAMVVAGFARIVRQTVMSRIWKERRRAALQNRRVNKGG